MSNNRAHKNGGKIFVHIGLPKTATSSLQIEFFPKIENEENKYIGVDGNRNNINNDGLYDQIVAFIESDNGCDLVVAKINDYLRTKNIIFSEEMLTVSSEKLSWMDKLDRLAKLLRRCDYELIVSVRDPRSALFSYYVELYPRFLNKGFIDSINSEAFEIFRYEIFLNVLLSKFDRSHIHLVKFEDVISGKLDSLSSLFALDFSETNCKLSNHNRRTSVHGAVIRQEKMSRLEYLNSFMNRYGIAERIPKSIKMLVRPVYRKLYGKLVFNPKVPLLTPTEIAQVEKMTKSGRAFLKLTFGIDYCD